MMSYIDNCVTLLCRLNARSARAIAPGCSGPSRSHCRAEGFTPFFPGICTANIVTACLVAKKRHGVFIPDKSELCCRLVKTAVYVNIFSILCIKNNVSVSRQVTGDAKGVD